MEWNEVAADIVWIIDNLQDEDYALQSDSTYFHRILTENVEARHLLAHILEGPRRNLLLNDDYDPALDYDDILTHWCRNNRAST